MSDKKNKSEKIIVAIITAIIGPIVVFLFLRFFEQANQQQVQNSERLLLEQINFDYWDSPELHGWNVVDPQPPNFTHITSGYIGKALQITSDEGYAMDYSVSSTVGFGTVVEYVLKPDENTMVYTKINVLSQDGTVSKEKWFTFVPGTRKPTVHYDDRSEWTIFVNPEQLGNGWVIYRVNLEEISKDTIETDGWELEKILAIRLRNSMSIASISIYE